MKLQFCPKKVKNAFVIEQMTYSMIDQTKKAKNFHVSKDSTLI